MRFLRDKDYFISIQPSQLSQITQGNIENRFIAEDDAIEDISEYLQQKYDVEDAFAPLLPYSPTGTYYGNSRVFLFAPAWILQNYTVNQMVLYTDNMVYLCILNTVNNEAPGNATYWVALGWNEQIFYMQFPYPNFNIDCDYVAGQKVFWRGLVYTCLVNTSTLSDFMRIQYNYTTDFPQKNAIPDQPESGVVQWGVGTAFSTTGYVIGQNPPAAYNPGATYSIGDLASVGTQVWQSQTNNNLGNIPGADIVNWMPLTWVAKDNRNKKLVRTMVHFVIFYLHSTIAPANVPMFRQANFKKAEEWCEDIKEGNKVVDLLTMPVLQPRQGGRILIGSEPKRNNSWA